MNADILLVMTTCADAAAAAKLADSIVAGRLAACVNAIDDVRSTYRWNEQVETATETLLLVKTTPERYAALERHIREHSGYELPEVVAVRSTGGFADYLGWVHAATTPETARAGDAAGAHEER